MTLPGLEALAVDDDRLRRVAGDPALGEAALARAEREHETAERASTAAREAARR